MLLLSLQSCLTLCDPIDGRPPGSPVPGILQARTLEWVAISFSNAWKWKVKVKLLSRIRLLATPWTAAYQAPPSMGFSRQEYWSGVPLPSSPLCLYDFKFHIFSNKPLPQSIATEVYMVQGYRFSRNMDILFFWEIHWTWYWEATFSLMTALDLNFSSIFLTFHIISWSHFIF